MSSLTRSHANSGYELNAGQPSAIAIAPSLLQSKNATGSRRNYASYGGISKLSNAQSRNEKNPTANELLKSRSAPDSRKKPGSLLLKRCSTYSWGPLSPSALVLIFRRLPPVLSPVSSIFAGYLITLLRGRSMGCSLSKASLKRHSTSCSTDLSLMALERSKWS